MNVLNLTVHSVVFTNMFHTLEVYLLLFVLKGIFSIQISNEDMVEKKSLLNQCEKNGYKIYIDYNTTYPSSCSKRNMVPFKRYIKCLNATAFPIWMPIQKKTSVYGYEHFKWIELSSNYGENFDHTYQFQETLSDKNCMILKSNLTVQAVSCDDLYNAVCSEKLILNATEPKVINIPKLKLTHEDNHLILTIQDYTNLLFLENEVCPFINCFTDSSFNELTTKLTNLTFEGCENTSCIFHIYFKKIGPGNFFCEGFLKSFDSIQSNIVLLRMGNEYKCEFVADFVYKYFSNNYFNPYSVLNYIYTIFSTDVTYPKPYYPRLYRITNINETIHVISFTIHFYTKNTEELCTTEFNNLKSNLISQIGNYNISMTYFTSVDFCMGMILNTTNGVSLLWPATNIGEVTYPTEVCIKNEYGEQISRACGGNFIAGAKWKDVLENCTRLETSEFTEKLKDINHNEEGFTALNHTLLISEFYLKLTALDVEIITTILENKTFIISTLEYFNEDEIYFDIINNIFNVPKSVLKTAQSFFNSTDKIINIMFTFYQHKNNIKEICQSNFRIVELSDRGLYLNDKNNIIFIKDDSNTNIIDIINQPSVHSAVILSSSFFELLNEIQVNIIVFFNNVILGEFNMILTSTIHYGVISNREIPYPFYIKYNKINEFNDSCVFYNFSNQLEYKGFWSSAIKTDNLYASCEYNFAGIFSLGDIENTITENLSEILHSNTSILNKLQRLDYICNSFLNFRPIDIKYISDILELAAVSDEYDIKLTTSIVNNVLNTPSEIFKDSQLQYHATDRILYFLDKILEKSNNSEIIYEENVSIVSVDLQVLNITGIALNETDAGYNIYPIFDEITIDSTETSCAILFDEKLLEQLRHHSNITSSLSFVISIFFNNGLFVEDQYRRKTGIIFGVLLPLFLEDFKGNISIFYNKTLFNISDENDCAFWNYSIDSYTGFWKSDHSNIELLKMSVCEFSHTTHFVMLLSDQNVDDEYRILDLITNICCGLSLFGVVCILITGLLFKKWRKNAGNQILLNFVIAISLKIILLYISNMIYEDNLYNKYVCIVFGAILHFALLSEFCWMFMISILQFKRFVEVLGGPPQYILVKAYVCGWVLPVIPVFTLLAVNPQSYIQGNAGICYPSHLGLYLGVWLPICLILLINIIVFYFIMYNVCYRKTEYRDRSSQDVFFQWRLAVLLFFMLGLTWLFGLMAQIKNFNIFAYLFTITATLQGFVMFLFFILFNKSTRMLYINTLRQLRQSNINYSVK